MKLCTRCRELVEYSGFYQEKGAKDGLASACKRCVGKSQRAYRGSELVQRRLNLARRAWRKTPKGRAFQERERKSLQGLARRAVQRARRRGKLIPGPCAVCSTDKVEGHHHEGYEKEHWLDVQWLCQACHQRTE